MKKAIILLFILIFSTAIVRAESSELLELVHSSKNSGKPILLKVFESDTYDFSFDSISFADKFIEASFYASNSSGQAIVSEYKVEAYPSIILLNSSGHLILPVKKIGSLAEVEKYMEQALKIKHEIKPLAQFDHEYRNNKMSKASLHEYISKRTYSRLDNSELIDKYTQMATVDDLLDRNILMLFFDENTFNIPGVFYGFVEQNSEQIKQILNLSDEQFNLATEKSIEHSFQKSCHNRDEAALRQIIDIRANVFDVGGNREFLYNEYMTRYFHLTYQPLKLASHVREYVNAILKYGERQGDELSERNKHLFSSSLQNDAACDMCASKLRNAAQYVVELMSAKFMLNDALSWSVKAEQLADSDKCEIYETQAYILYKLGKKDEAIERIEKAYNSIPQNNTEQMKSIGLNLVKMKRGEKIY
jgi:hypothetical protein